MRIQYKADWPSRKERVADSEESLEGQGHGAVDAAHQPDLGDRHHERKWTNPNKLIVAYKMLKMKFKFLVRGLNSKNINSEREGDKCRKWVRGFKVLGYEPRAPAGLGYGKEG